MIKFLKCFSLAVLLCCSCSTTVVNVHKTVVIWGKDNHVEVTGSDLEDNQMKQSSTFDLVLEWLYP